MGDVLEGWNSYVERDREADLARIIKEERPKEFFLWFFGIGGRAFRAEKTEMDADEKPFSAGAMTISAFVIRIASKVIGLFLE